MSRPLSVFVALSGMLALVLAGCQSAGTAKPVASPAAPAYPAPAAAAPRPVTAPVSVPISHVASARNVSTGGGYVRLRGSPEIHVRTCALVRRAHPDGVVAAGAGDGPACALCRKAEVRSPLPPVPSRSPVAAVPTARSVASAPAGYVRLRGSPEIHLRTCPKVARAHPDGVVPAKRGDGPPCHECLSGGSVAGR